MILVFQRAETVCALESRSHWDRRQFTQEKKKISSYINKFKKKHIVVHLSNLSITQHYTGSNDWKGRGTKWSWSNIMYCSCNFSHEPKENTKNFVRDSSTSRKPYRSSQLACSVEIYCIPASVMRFRYMLYGIKLETWGLIPFREIKLSPIKSRLLVVHKQAVPIAALPLLMGSYSCVEMFPISHCAVLQLLHQWDRLNFSLSWEKCQAF
jgi:hypothetical protein